ncbi:MAG: glycoside hydrolase family 43 protein [Defluviitaleaceae bacterium]|nr:glycoside hydrolase family 43 protein [Defluviitaleaceae bacterium]
MKKLNEIHIRDPFILPDKKTGKYYMYGSTISRSHKEPGFDCYASVDLIDWEEPVPIFRPDVSFWGKTDFWAAEAHEYNGDYYLFATFSNEGTVHMKDRMRGVGILRAHSPSGPFADHTGGPVTPSDCMCLDGSLYIDEEKNPWLVYCHEWVQLGNGAVCAVRLSHDLKSAVGEPHVIFHSLDASWSTLVEMPDMGYRGYVTDGCFVRRMKNGKLSLLWSCSCASGYCVGQAISSGGKITGDWVMDKEPLFVTDGGHGMLFESFDGDLLFPMHSPNKHPLERPVIYRTEENENGFSITGRHG